MARSVMIKTKPKTYNVGDVIQVDAILEHPMETGLRKDKDGKVIPAHHTTTCVMLSYPISWITTTALIIPYYLYRKKHAYD